MSLLGDVPGSVLWLHGGEATAQENLRRTAQTRGIDPRRLIFASRPAKPEHLRRLALADIALDTRSYNGHTTSLDALFAGVPLVAELGGQFASRVAASALNAVGLPGLIARSGAQYAEIALRLAEDADARGAIRAVLAEARGKAPLLRRAALRAQSGARLRDHDGPPAPRRATGAHRCEGVLMRNLARRLAFGLFVLAIVSASAQADDLANGEALYKKGDYAGAFREFVPLAQHGDPRAQIYLGWMYVGGRGVSPDDNLASAGFAARRRRAAPAARQASATCIWLERAWPKVTSKPRSGTGSPPSRVMRTHRTALAGFTRPARTASRKTTTRLSSGSVVPRHKAVSTANMRWALPMNMAAAPARIWTRPSPGTAVPRPREIRMQRTLWAGCTRRGLAVVKDEGEAARWYRLAALMGNSQAQETLAWLYYKGQGVPEDMVHALMWLDIAASTAATGKANDLAQKRDAVAHGLTAAQVQQAKSLADDCRASAYRQCS